MPKRLIAPPQLNEEISSALLALLKASKRKTQQVKAQEHNGTTRAGISRSQSKSRRIAQLKKAGRNKSFWASTNISTCEKTQKSRFDRDCCTRDGPTAALGRLATGSTIQCVDHVTIGGCALLAALRHHVLNTHPSTVAIACLRWRIAIAR